MPDPAELWALFILAGAGLVAVGFGLGLLAARWFLRESICYFRTWPKDVLNREREHK